ncbi:MAG: aldo/keto reductase [Verrucomicrobiota bacterium]
MLYRTYGKTGKSISVLGAGCMRFRTPMTPRGMEESAEILLHAHAKGINYFDTAPLYCDDRSEEIAGLAVRRMKPGTFYVSTKSQATDADSLRRDLERSLKRMAVDRIHFFHIWCLLRPEEWEERKRGGVVKAALRAKEEGLIEHLVFSTHMSGDETARVIREGVFEGVTLGYSAINFPYRRRGLDAAAQAGLGVVTMNPLGGGVIPGHAERFDFIRGGGDPDVVTAALRFNLSHPAITSALVGFSSQQEVDQAVAALDGFAPYDAAFIGALEKKIEDRFDGLCTGCGYCLPCPKDVPIPKYMDAYNMYMLENTRDGLLARLKWHWDLTTRDAGRCDGCGQCEGACTQSLPIIERLREIGNPGS